MNPKAAGALAWLVLLGDCSPPPPRRANLLLVTIDTLRADHLGCAGYASDTTPTIDALAREGLRFTAASTPRAKTTPAMASLFTGAYPHEHGVRDLLTPIDPARPLFAEALRAVGYQTAAIVGNYVLQARHCGLQRGFQHYVDVLPSRQGVPPHDAPQRTARSLTDAALVALDLASPPALDEDGKAFAPDSALLARGDPWFLWLHYMDPHGAYDPPAEDRLFAPTAPRWVDPRAQVQGRAPRVADYNVPPELRDDQGRFDAAGVIARYDGEIRHVDRQLGRLVDALRDSGELAHTWIVVTSDHGESLGEQNYWFEHGFYAYQSTAAVPLIVRPPDGASIARGSVREDPISLVDLSPTLGAWLGVATPVGRTIPVGVSRAELLERDGAVPHATFVEKIEAADRAGAVQIKGVRRGDWKLLRRLAHAPAAGEPRRGSELGRLVLLGEELYHVGRDPLESEDLSRRAPLEAQLESLRLSLLEFTAADRPFAELAETLAKARAALESRDPAAMRELRALGY